MYFIMLSMLHVCMLCITHSTVRMCTYFVTDRYFVEYEEDELLGAGASAYAIRVLSCAVLPVPVYLTCCLVSRRYCLKDNFTLFR